MKRETLSEKGVAVKRGGEEPIKNPFFYELSRTAQIAKKCIKIFFKNL